MKHESCTYWCDAERGIHTGLCLRRRERGDSGVASTPTPPANTTTTEVCSVQDNGRSAQVVGGPHSMQSANLPDGEWLVEYLHKVAELCPELRSQTVVAEFKVAGLHALAKEFMAEQAEAESERAPAPPEPATPKECDCGIGTGQPQVDHANSCSSRRTTVSVDLKEHVIQLGAIAMAGINQPLWETRNKLDAYLSEHFVLAAASRTRIESLETALLEINELCSGEAATHGWPLDFKVTKLRARIMDIAGEALGGESAK